MHSSFANDTKMYIKISQLFCNCNLYLIIQNKKKQQQQRQQKKNRVERYTKQNIFYKQVIKVEKKYTIHSLFAPYFSYLMVA